jgi:hypothetical protein
MAQTPDTHATPGKGLSPVLAATIHAGATGVRVRLTRIACTLVAPGAPGNGVGNACQVIQMWFVLSSAMTGFSCTPVSA